MFREKGYKVEERERLTLAGNQNCVSYSNGLAVADVFLTSLAETIVVIVL